ncbi:MAG: hypothetical protein ACRC5T_03920 [Cetobacterium sp.]
MKKKLFLISIAIISILGTQTVFAYKGSGLSKESYDLIDCVQRNETESGFKACMISRGHKR